MHARQEADSGAPPVQRPERKPRVAVERPAIPDEDEPVPKYSGLKHAVLCILIVAAWLLLCILLRQLV
jgi:hypothetical protein